MKNRTQRVIIHLIILVDTDTVREMARDEARRGELSRVFLRDISNKTKSLIKQDF